MKVASTFAACLLACLASAAQAGIVSVTAGTGTIQNPPATLSLNSLQSDTSVFVWQESTQTLGANRTIASDTQTIDGNPVSVNSGTAAVSGTLTAGSYVSSYYVHFDPIGSFATPTPVTLTFTDLILGFDITSTQLNNGDATYGPGINYSLGGTPRGLNFGNDTVTVSADRLSITFFLDATGGDTIDDFRIIVNPEPGTFALFGLGGLGLAFLARRRKQRRVVSA